MYKSAFLIAARQVVSDIEKNAVFTRENMGSRLYSCKGHVRLRTFWMGTLVYDPKNSHIKIHNKGVFEEILRGAFSLFLRFGSFLENVVVCGNQLRALSDFFARKSMSGRGGSGAEEQAGSGCR